MSGESIDWAAQDWEDVIPRLLLLAVQRLARPAVQGDGQGRSVPAMEAQELVEKAIARTQSGMEVWEPGDCTLFEHLAAIVIGDISGLGGAAGYPLAAPPPAGDGRSEAWRDDRRSLLDHLYDKDEKLGEMASLILLENCRETAELAGALEVVPLEITHMRRRMSKEVRVYIAEHGR